MGLRLAEGIDLEAIGDRFGLKEVADWRRIDRLVASGHLERENMRIALTGNGRLVLDYILGEIALAASLMLWRLRSGCRSGRRSYDCRSCRGRRSGRLRRVHAGHELVIVGRG